MCAINFRGLSVFIEELEDVMRIFLHKGKESQEVYAVALSIKKISRGEDKEEDDVNIKVLNAIVTRASETGYKYVIQSCIDARSLHTYIIIVAEDRESALKEAEILCSLIISITEGSVLCKIEKSKTMINTIKRCFIGYDVVNPFTWLRSLMVRKMGLEVENFVLFPPLSFELGYPLVKVEKYDLLESVFSEGRIRLGTVTTTKIIAKLKVEHILRHILIVGSTGSGKSTTASIIARELLREGVSVFIIDWHGEYKELLKGVEVVDYTNPVEGTIPEFLNLKDLMLFEPLAFIEILESALELTPAQVHILEEAVRELATRRSIGFYDIDILIDVIQNTPLSARWIAESREALIRKLKVLSSDYLKIKWRDLKEVPTRKGYATIFDLSQIPNTRVKRVLASISIKTAALKAQYNRIDKPFIIIVDEAHNVFTKDNPVSNLIAEVRKWGVGFIIVTQSPSALAQTVLKNTNTRIVHALKSSIDVKTMLGLLVLRKEYKKIISSLKPGEALLSIPELSEPVLLKIGVF
jgi:hypothetical protein